MPPFEQSKPGAGEAQAPQPDTEFRRALTDDEVRDLGYTHRDEDGRWVRPPQKRRSATGRAPKPTHVTNPDAMVDAIRDAMWNRPTIGALRRGEVSPNGDSPAPFDWRAVRRRVDDVHAREVDRVLNPRREVPRPPEGAVRRRRNDAAKGPSYTLAALESEADAVRSAPHGMRNIMLAESAWTLARPELAGLVDAATIEDVLVEAGVDAGLPELEARSVVRRAIRKRGAT
jgi:hypothetical protein